MQRDHGGKSREKGGKKNSIITWASQNVAQTLSGASEGSDVLLHNGAEEKSPETLINESWMAWASVTVSAVLTGQESSNGAYNGPQERSKAERDVRAPQLQYNIH